MTYISRFLCVGVRDVLNDFPLSLIGKVLGIHYIIFPFL